MEPSNIHRHKVPDYDSKWTMNKYIFKCFLKVNRVLHYLTVNSKMFHIEGPMWLNAMSPKEVLVHGMTNSSIMPKEGHSFGCEAEWYQVT